MERWRWRWRWGQREHAAVWWIGFAALGIGILLMRSSWAALLLLVAWCLYQFCLVPTACRVGTRQGFSCAEPVRGRLFACTPAHQEVKTDALWGLAGVRNPFRRTREPDPNRTTGVLVVSPPVRARLALTDQVLIALAAAGTIITAVAGISGLF